MQQITDFLDQNPQIGYVLWLVGTAIVTAIFRKRDPEAEERFREKWPKLYGLREIVRALGLDSPKLLAAIVSIFGPKKVRDQIDITVVTPGDDGK